MFTTAEDDNNIDFTQQRLVAQIATEITTMAASPPWLSSCLTTNTTSQYEATNNNANYKTNHLNYYHSENSQDICSSEP